MISTLTQAEHYLQQDVKSHLVPGDLFLRRTRYFLNLLGNPQERMKGIHIAGTSGKSSTSYFIHTLLAKQGFRTGLHLSPHLVDIRERFMLNTQLVPEETFCTCLNQIIPIREKMRDTEYGIPSYFETCLILAYMLFEKENVKYAVIETGLGGRLDPTNCVSNPNKVCVLTKIGYDHMDFLGDTLEQIATEKAHIIQQGNHCIAMEQEPHIEALIQTHAKKKNATLDIIHTEEQYGHNKQGRGEWWFSYQEVSYPTLTTCLPGTYHVENLATALATVVHILTRDGQTDTLSEATIQKSISTLRMPGRMEVRQYKGRTVVLDAAHNQQKMQTFLQSFAQEYPGQKAIFLLSFKQDKQYQEMLTHILPYAHKIYITRFAYGDSDYVKKSLEPEQIADQLQIHGMSNYTIQEDPEEAFSQALEDKKNLPLVVTGSLYLVGDISKKM